MAATGCQLLSDHEYTRITSVITSNYWIISMSGAGDFLWQTRKATAGVKMSRRRGKLRRRLNDLVAKGTGPKTGRLALRVRVRGLDGFLQLGLGHVRVNLRRADRLVAEQL